MVVALVDAKAMKEATLKAFPGMTEEMWFAYWKQLRISGAVVMTGHTK